MTKHSTTDSEILNWYNEEVARNTKDPKILHKILERNKEDLVSQYASENCNCSPETLKIILERNKEGLVSQYAAMNPNCPPEALQTVLERNQNDNVSINAVNNLNCLPEMLQMVLERNIDDEVSSYAAENPNCSPEARLKWLQNTNQIGQYSEEDYTPSKVDKVDNLNLEELKRLL